MKQIIEILSSSVFWAAVSAIAALVVAIPILVRFFRLRRLEFSKTLLARMEKATFIKKQDISLFLWGYPNSSPGSVEAVRFERAKRVREIARKKKNLEQAITEIEKSFPSVWDDKVAPWMKEYTLNGEAVGVEQIELSARIVVNNNADKPILLAPMVGVEKDADIEISQKTIGWHQAKKWLRQLFARGFENSKLVRVRYVINIASPIQNKYFTVEPNRSYELDIAIRLFLDYQPDDWAYDKALIRLEAGQQLANHLKKKNGIMVKVDFETASLNKRHKYSRVFALKIINGKDEFEVAKLNIERLKMNWKIIREAM